MRKILIIGIVVALAVAATWFLYEELRSKDGDLPPVACQGLDGVIAPRGVADWPGEVLANWDNDIPNGIDGLLGVRPGMVSIEACEALYDQGLTLSDTMVVRYRSESQIHYDEIKYASRLYMSGSGRPLDLTQDSPIIVEVGLGTPAAGYTVETILLEYFFADQGTPEPQLETLQAATISRFGQPSVQFGPAANTHMYWLVDKGGLSSRGFLQTCGFEFTPADSIWQKLHDETNPDPARCTALLHVSFGGNRGANASKTARFLRMELIDFQRTFRNRAHVEAIVADHEAAPRSGTRLLPPPEN